jgi:lipopolysaccharide transport system permease protein/teichoic acid transport system permease protein
MIYIKQFIGFIVDIIRSRQLIFELTKKDFRSRYLGSYLGIIWAFVQPTITIAIFWFVFQVGFKSVPIDNFPFILWLMAGLIPWFFINDAVLNGTNSVLDNSYLVKKVVFRVSILPIIKILSALVIHLFFVVFLLVMMAVYGHMPNLFYLQVLYYLFASIVLALGISWITSSLVIFLKDIGQLVSIFLQFTFWLTPIFWNINVLPARYHFVFKLNPFAYIINGYRETFIYHVRFWDHYNLTAYFWIETLIIFIIGALLFRRLRPHFADVI